MSSSSLWMCLMPFHCFPYAVISSTTLVKMSTQIQWTVISFTSSSFTPILFCIYPFHTFLPQNSKSNLSYIFILQVVQFRAQSYHLHMWKLLQHITHIPYTAILIYRLLTWWFSELQCQHCVSDYHAHASEVLRLSILLCLLSFCLCQPQMQPGL
jgi:hypothetical protein